MGSDVTGSGNQDVLPFRCRSPLVKLTDARLQHLEGVEVGIFSQDAMCQRGNQGLNGVTQLQVTSRQCRNGQVLPRSVASFQNGSSQLFTVSRQIVQWFSLAR